MMLKQEILDLLRADQAFREEVRQQILTEDLLALPERFDRLSEMMHELVGTVRELAEAQQRTEQTLRRHSEQIEALIEAQRRTEAALQRHDQLIQRNTEQIQALIEAQHRTEAALQRQSEQIEALIEAQRRTEEELKRLVNWQRGEAGRCDGERYERDTIRRAFVLFNGGHGGAPDQDRVAQWLAEQLGSLENMAALAPEEDPFLADLIWHKGETTAVVEILLQVTGQDIVRAARRAETLRRAGIQALAVVIGDEWVVLDAHDQAQARQVEWKVGSDLSEGFLNLRRAPSG